MCSILFFQGQGVCTRTTLWVVGVLGAVGQKLQSVSEMSETITLAQGFTSPGCGHHNCLSNVHGARDATVFHGTCRGLRFSLFPSFWYCLWHWWEELLHPAGRFFCCKHLSLLLLHLRRYVNPKKVTDIRREGKPLDIRSLLGLRYQMKHCWQGTVQGCEGLQYTPVLNPEDRRQKGIESPLAKHDAHWTTTFSSAALSLFPLCTNLPFYTSSPCFP